MKKSIFYLLSLSAITITIVSACVKDEPAPENPFNKIDYGQDTVAADTVNPASLLGLHRNIFSVRCAIPGCHDGNFEPDFRTVQSSYSTLVYAPVIKNNDANAFSFRVIPGNPAMSVLHERITNCCFVNEDDRMPQDNIGVPLQQNLIDNVTTWIQDGAKNYYGETANRPDLEPLFAYYVAVNTTFDVEYSAINNRVDSVIYNPFIIPTGTENFYLATFVEDDITEIADMQFNKLFISTSIDDFSAAMELSAVFIPGADPLWLVSVPANTLTPGQIYYMRYYANDGTHTENTEFPKDESVEFYKTYWSFIIQP